MGINTVHTCFRCHENCYPIANISSDTKDKSFICIGYNNLEDRAISDDKFTLCWKNDFVDDLSHWDKRDLIDTMSVIAQALSIDENIRISKGLK